MIRTDIFRNSLWALIFTTGRDTESITTKRKEAREMRFNYISELINSDAPRARVCLRC